MTDIDTTAASDESTTPPQDTTTDVDLTNIEVRVDQPVVIPAVIAKGIIAIQKVATPFLKSAENSEYKSSFVPLSEVFPKTLQLLSDQALGVTQWAISEGEKNFLITVLFHESGASITGKTELMLGKRDSQGHGSAITYIRRYSLMSMLGLVGQDDDDDGNKAAGRNLKPTPEQLSEIEQLAIDLKYPKEHIAARIASIRTMDHADVAINNLHELMGKRSKQIKGEANAIPVFSGSRDDRYAEENVQTTESRIDNLNRRILNLDMPSSKRSHFVFSLTKKPFLNKCTTEEIDLVEDTIREMEQKQQDGIVPPEDTA